MEKVFNTLDGFLDGVANVQLVAIFILVDVCHTVNPVFEEDFPCQMTSCFYIWCSYISRKGVSMHQKWGLSDPRWATGGHISCLKLVFVSRFTLHCAAIYVKF